MTERSATNFTAAETKGKKTMEAVFLGLNDAGEQIYNWLNQRKDVDVKALLTEKDQLDLIEALQPEIVISAGFEHKVPEDIIEVPDKGVVNVHPSFLPYLKELLQESQYIT